MNVVQNIAAFSSQPLTHQLLLSWLKECKRPNDKINELKAEGMLILVKKRLYMAGPMANNGRPEDILIANHILGPSYVSMDTALAWYGLIPERVYEVASVTRKASREFNTSVALFTYTRLALPYYSFGITSIRLAESQNAIIATPEKALIDKIITTPGLILRSVKGASDYLLDNMRMDETNLKGFDISMMSKWLNDAPKRQSLDNVIKTISRL